MSDRTWKVLFILPAVVVTGLLIAYPTIWAIALSLCRRDTLLPDITFVGFKNFYRIFRDFYFWRNLCQGTIYAGGSVGLQIVVGIALALLLNRNFKGGRIARSLILLPYVIPVVVTVAVWKWMLNDLTGIVNYVLLSLRLIESPIGWLSTPSKAMTTLIFVSGWQWYPFVIMLVLARLRVIPPVFYEAAKIDGASGWAQFWHITVPQISHTLGMVIVIRIIWTFNKLDMVLLLTGGGPSGFTSNLPLYAYERAFVFHRMGQASSIGVMMLVILSLVAWPYIKEMTQGEYA